MLAEDRLREGDLEESLRQLQEQVRKQPANAKYRVFLFQLLAIMGQWDRAMNQLNVAGDLDAGTLAMVQTYREALRCEVLRGEIFAGRRSPLVFGKPDEWVALLLEAQRLVAQGAFVEAGAVRERALEAAPTTAGMIDGVPFDWLIDGDTRLGPVLEAIVNGRYYWIPFQRIRSIAVEKPEDLRDLVWMPVQFRLGQRRRVRGSDPDPLRGLRDLRGPGSAPQPQDRLAGAARRDLYRPGATHALHR